MTAHAKARPPAGQCRASGMRAFGWRRKACAFCSPSSSPLLTLQTLQVEVSLSCIWHGTNSRKVTESDSCFRLTMTPFFLISTAAAPARTCFCGSGVTGNVTAFCWLQIDHIGSLGFLQDFLWQCFQNKLYYVIIQNWKERKKIIWENSNTQFLKLYRIYMKGRVAAFPLCNWGFTVYMWFCFNTYLNDQHNLPALRAAKVTCESNL